MIDASSKSQVAEAGLETRVSSGHIGSVHLMRGIAALLVVMEHITGRYGYPGFNSLFWFFDGLGQAGVAGFFVISGIVLPLSLGKVYRWREFPRFLLRRIVRIEFTYIASIVFAVALVGAISSLSRNGDLVLPSLRQLSLHPLYLIPFSSESWIQAVYWTLAVEFQFYLSIGLLFPLVSMLAQRRNGLAVVACASFALLVWVSGWCPEVKLLKYSPCFALGMVVAVRRMYGVGVGLTAACGVAVLAVAVLGGLGMDVVLASGITALIATIWSGRVDREMFWVKPFWILGTISYSLYVTHQVIASAGENVARMILRMVPGNPGAVLANLVPVGSLIASLLVAWLLFRWVERPSQKLSRRLKV
ncbi:acyltransferase [Verrucomicrobiales bacterium]|nr:acyltransferase [Verrucomicrobiales bacterium]